MAPNRKHHAVDAAADERWELLGKLLRTRRLELGYGFRPAFAEARLPKTAGGNLMIRMVNTIENNERPGTYAPGRLEQFARAYGVTLESILAVLDGKADELTPAGLAGPPAAAPPADGPDGWRPPIADKARRDADAPYAMEIMERLLALADAGTIDPTGAQVFPDAPGDAKAWDGIGARLPVRDRVWFIADLRRWDADNAGSSGNSGTGVTGA